MKARVYGVICFGMDLTLRKGNREYFYNQLDRLFPHIKEKSIQTYGSQYQINSPKNSELIKVFHQICGDNGILKENWLTQHHLNNSKNDEKIEISLCYNILSERREPNAKSDSTYCFTSYPVH